MQRALKVFGLLSLLKCICIIYQNMKPSGIILSYSSNILYYKTKYTYNELHSFLYIYIYIYIYIRYCITDNTHSLHL